MRDCDIKFVNKEITPFGGLSLFFKMLERCHFDEHLEQSGIPVQGSNRGYKPLQLILGLFAGVWCGASCFGHLDVVRYDTALCKLLGWERGADHRAYQRYFNKFSQAVNQRVFGELFSWFFSELLFDNYTLNLSSRKSSIILCFLNSRFLTFSGSLNPLRFIICMSTFALSVTQAALHEMTRATSYVAFSSSKLRCTILRKLLCFCAIFANFLFLYIPLNIFSQ